MIIYEIPLISNRLTDVVNAIDGGGAPGICRLLDAGSAILSSPRLSRPCGSVAGSLLTFSGMPWIDAAATGSGPAVAARIEDSTGTTIVSGLTVGTGSTAYDIVISPSNVLVAGQTVEITLATITGR